jgi:predicted transcriptional regulator
LRQAAVQETAGDLTEKRVLAQRRQPPERLLGQARLSLGQPQHGDELRPGSLCDNVLLITQAAMTTLTIRLDAKLEKALDRIAKTSGRTKSEIAREALRRQIAVARFRQLRRKTLPFAEAQGLVTDEDVFRALS